MKQQRRLAAPGIALGIALGITLLVMVFSVGSDEPQSRAPIDVASLGPQVGEAEANR